MRQAGHGPVVADTLTCPSLGLHLKAQAQLQSSSSISAFIAA